MRKIVDAHLDLAWNALSWNRDLTRSIQDIRALEAHMTDDDARGHGTVSLPELRHANVCVCLGTVLTRAKENVRPPTGHRRIDVDVFDQTIAYACGRGQLAYYEQLERLEEIRFIRSQTDLQRHLNAWPCRSIGLILAMEGADPIASPEQAGHWWSLGLRCVGLAHYGKSHYAVGTGDSGSLTPKGIELLKHFERLGMIVDLTHSSDPSFYEILDNFSGPVLASHNNCRALVPGDRQFSDEQIKLIIQRGGVIGAVFDAWMMMPGYKIGQTPRSAVPLKNAADHIDHICQIAGNTNHVGIGSDLDGGYGTEQCPDGLETITDLHKLEAILASRGYSDSDLDKLFHGNWLRFFQQHLPKD